MNLKKIVLIGICLAISAVVSSAAWIPLSSPAFTAGAAEVTILGSGSSGVIIEFTVPGIETGRAAGSGPGDLFDIVTVPGCVNAGETGSPSLPEFSSLFELETGMAPTVELLDSEYITLENLRLFPKLADVLEGEEPVFVIDRAAYAINNFTPVDLVASGEPGVLRDLSVSKLAFHPVQYNPVSSKARVYSRIRVLVTEQPGSGPGAFPVRRPTSPDIINLYSALVCNYHRPDLSSESLDQDEIKFLVITKPEYYDELAPLVEWRRRIGIPVEVVSVDDIGQDPRLVKDYIADLYFTDGLEYVLLGGDIDDIPAYYWESGGSTLDSDNWYACVDPGGDTDFLPELGLGRITFDTPEELTRQVNKILSYLTAPSTGSGWPEANMLVAHQQNYPEKYTANCEEVRLYDYAVQDPVFLTAYGGAGAGNDDVISAVNNGLGILHYRGHGAGTCWGNWGVDGLFTIDEIDMFTNSDELFVGFGIACSNATLDYPGDCFSESFVKSEAGAVAYLGSWNSSVTTSNDIFAKALFKAIYDAGVTTIGFAKVLGDIETDSARHSKQYLWLGDPAVDIWTLRPAPFDVGLPEIIAPVAQTISITVELNGSPAEGARICLAVEDEFSIYGFTGPEGTAAFELPLTGPCTMRITITGHNGLPFEEFIDVEYPEAPWIFITDHALDDSLSGNGDGKAGYGEKITLNTELSNVGLDTACGITGYATCDDGQIGFSIPVDDYGDIAFRDTVRGATGYTFVVDVGCPDLHWSTIDFLFSDGLGSVWERSLDIVLHAPVLEATGMIADESDPGHGDGDGIVESGETALLLIPMANSGSSDAAALTGTLSTSDTMVTILSGEADFGDIPAYGAGENIDPFLIEVDSACPGNRRIIFNLHLETAMGYKVDAELFLYVGRFCDNMESGEGDWTSFPVTPGFEDEWHLSEQTSYPPAPGHSWKCGDDGGGDYSNRLDAGLVTPPLYIHPNSILEFKHRIAAEKICPGVAVDGGRVELSMDDGASWSLIEPVTYYRFFIDVNTTGPFEPYSPCYSGRREWKKGVFDLSAFEGEARLMFRFGSDTLNTDIGWFIDEVSLTEAPDLDLRVIEAPFSVERGSTVSWDIWVRNKGESTSGDFWITADNGEGLVVDIPMQSALAIPGGYDGVSHVSRTVHSAAPHGWYEIRCSLGEFPDEVAVSDAFPLEIHP